MKFRTVLTIVINCFVILLFVAAAFGQAPSQTEVDSSTLSNQVFHCHPGYTQAQCEEDVSKLKAVLEKYPAAELGQWTWVLVRSQDWSMFVRPLKLDPDSPAFTARVHRITFFDEALFGRQPLRGGELQQIWLMPINRLLDLAVTHELGHALCNEPDEETAERFGEELRRGRTPKCRNSRGRDRRSSSAIAMK